MASSKKDAKRRRRAQQLADRAVRLILFSDGDTFLPHPRH
jgi:hypothetical protein